ncbi:MAG TPA: response regulator transcription factor [Rubrobacter sp.]|nr:response regulator transcription factor [Rubrobacter sp.]
MTDESPSKPFRVALVEDHASFRQALAFVFDLEQDFVVVEQVGSLAEARAAPREYDLAILDLALPDGSGVDLVEELRGPNPDVEVLVLSATLDEENVARLVDVGASGVLDKLAGVEEIVAEAQRLMAGAVLPRQREVVEILRTLARGGADPAATGDAGLTEPEAEVLRALAEGLDGEEAARRLGTTSGQVRHQVKGILEKLGARSGLQALVAAARRRLVEIR